MPDRSSAALRFLRRRLARGVPYGLGFTLAAAAVVAALWTFLAIVDSVFEQDAIYRFDAQAHQTVYETVGPGRLGLVEAVTFLGNNATLITLVVGVALALVLARRYWAAFRVVFASGLGGIVVVSLKALFARDRPLETVVPAHGYSLPSGHAFASTVFYGMMIYLTFRLTQNPALRALAVVGFGAVILAVGFSRVYLNVHYLTDVLAGFASGAAWLMASLLLVDAVEHRRRSRREVREETARPDDAAPEPPGPPG